MGTSGTAIGTAESLTAYNLFNLVHLTLRSLNVLKEGTATGGSTTTVIDTALLSRYEDDYWNGGTVGITYDGGGASAAPEGEFAVISNSDSSLSTVTCGTLTAAVASGDKYFIADDTYQLYDVIGAINRSLNNIEIPIWDETSVGDIAANQTEYSLPSDAKRGASSRKLRVWLERDKNDSNDQRWVEILNWRVEHSGIGGNADVLVLPYQYNSGYAVALEYAAPHPTLIAASDSLNEEVPWEMVVYSATVDLLWWRKSLFDWQDYQEIMPMFNKDGEVVGTEQMQTNWQKYKADQGQINDMIVKYEQMLEDVKRTHPMKLPRSPNEVLALSKTGGSLTGEDSEPNLVYLV